MENDFLMIDRIKLYLKEYSVLKSGYTLIIKKYRNEDSMKIAVAYENGNVFEHFGHSRQFKIYETDGQNIVKEEVINNIEYTLFSDLKDNSKICFRKTIIEDGEEYYVELDDKELELVSAHFAKNLLKEIDG